jgi:hypothetical protein
VSFHLTFVGDDVNSNVILPVNVGRTSILYHSFSSVCKDRVFLEKFTEGVIKCLGSSLYPQPQGVSPLNPGHFYEFRKFIEISPVGITK